MVGRSEKCERINFASSRESSVVDDIIFFKQSIFDSMLKLLELRKRKYLENICKECLAINVYRLSMLLGKVQCFIKLNGLSRLEKFIEFKWTPLIIKNSTWNYKEIMKCNKFSLKIIQSSILCSMKTAISYSLGWILENWMSLLKFINFYWFLKF